MALVAGLVMVTAQAQVVTNTSTGQTYTSLQAASDAALSGQSLSLSAGTFVESTRFSPGSITITGAGPGLTVVTAANSSGSLMELLGPDIEISNLTLTTDPNTTARLILSGWGFSMTDVDVVVANGTSTTLSPIYFLSINGDSEFTRVNFIGSGPGPHAKYGGAVTVSGATNSGAVHFHDCTFTGLVASEFGGAVYNSGGSVTFDGCVFQGNSAMGDTTMLGPGGAIYSFAGTVVVERSRFCSNFSLWGHGDDVAGDGIPGYAPVIELYSSIFAQGLGSAPIGYGVGDFVVENNSFLYNLLLTASSGETTPDSIEFRNNLFWNNVIAQGTVVGWTPAVIEYNWYEDGTTPFPSVSATNFVNASYTGDLITGWTGNCAEDPLYPAVVTSPLLDAGDPAILDPDGGRSDIGAFGGPHADAAFHLDGDGDGAQFLWDCDDEDPANAPTFSEVCDGGDNDCDGLADDADPSLPASAKPTWYADCDEDGVGNLYTAVIACTPPSSGCPWILTRGDCDDTDPNAFPGADETCAAGDQNCDGYDDDGAVDALTFYRDGDGDGHGSGPGIPSCTGDGLSAVSDDCDDENPEQFPGAPELCNGADDDCNGTADDLPPVAWYRDEDGDGHGALTETQSAGCSPGEGWVATGDDCDDSDESLWTSCPAGPDPGPAAEKDGSGGCSCDHTGAPGWTWLGTLLLVGRRRAARTA